MARAVLRARRETGERVRVRKEVCDFWRGEDKGEGGGVSFGLWTCGVEVNIFVVVGLVVGFAVGGDVMVVVRFLLGMDGMRWGGDGNCVREVTRCVRDGFQSTQVRSTPQPLSLSPLYSDDPKSPRSLPFPPLNSHSSPHPYNSIRTSSQTQTTFSSSLYPPP